jgi:hypothetical protein
MTHTLSVDEAGSQFLDLVERAVQNDERFLVDRDGEPTVIIISVSDFVKTIAPTPEWLAKIQEEAQAHGLDKLTSVEIDAEIAAARMERRRNQPPQGR